MQKWLQNVSSHGPLCGAKFMEGAFDIIVQNITCIEILAYSALAIGVEKDAIQEDKAFGHVAKIWHSQGAILD